MPIVQQLTPFSAIPSDTVNAAWQFPFSLNFDEAILNPSTLNYDLWIDTATTFSTPNNIKLTKTSNDSRLLGFSEGQNIGKSFLVSIPDRGFSADVVWYWQVRINSGTFISPWSQINSFTVPQRQDLVQTQILFNDLADGNAYTKDTNSSNVYKVLLQAGRELDLLLYEGTKSVSDLAISTARDTAIANNFGSLLQTTQFSYETAANYRYRVNELWTAFSQYPGSVQGLIDVVVAFVGQPPFFYDATTINGWILDQNFISVPGNPLTNPPIILFSRPQKGRTFSLIVYNSWNLMYDQSVLINFLNLMKPAQSDMQIEFSNQGTWSYRFNTLADWNTFSTSNADLATYPNSVAIAFGQTQSIVTSPILNIPTISAFGAPITNQTTSGGTVTYAISTSPDGINFSSFSPIYQGTNIGSNVLIQPYFKIQATLNRTTSGSPTPLLSWLEIPGLDTI